MTTIELKIKWGNSEMSSPVSFLRLLDCFVDQLNRQGWKLKENHVASDWWLEKSCESGHLDYQKRDVDKCYSVAVGEWACGGDDDHMLCDEPIDFFPLNYMLYMDYC